MIDLPRIRPERSDYTEIASVLRAADNLIKIGAHYRHKSTGDIYSTEACVVINNFPAATTGIGVVYRLHAEEADGYQDKPIRSRPAFVMPLEEFAEKMEQVASRMVKQWDLA